MSETQLAQEIMEQNERMDWEVEVHYNYYGSRGVIDLFGRNGSYGTVYELKSESALNSATGANDILRQFNRHKKYFTKGVSRRLPQNLHYMLVFEATQETVDHLRGNKSIYESVEDKHTTVAAHHTDTGIVPVINDAIWSNDVNAAELKELVE